MPVNLDISNSIISAYAQGKKEAFERQKNAQEQEQQAVENEDRIKRQKEQRRQFDEQLKNEKENQAKIHAFNDAKLDMEHQSQLQEFIKYSEASGNAPLGFTAVAKDQYEVSPGVFAYRTTAKNDKTGELISYREPDAVNKQKVAEGIAQRAPVIQEDKDMLKHKQTLEKELSHWSSEDRLNNEKVLQKSDQIWKGIEADKQRAHEIRMATEKHAVDLMIAGGKADAKGYELWNDYPMDDLALKVFGGQPGDTFKDVIGNAKLTAKGKNDLLSTMEMEPLIMDLIDDFSQVQEDGKDGYEHFFLGKGKGQIKDWIQELPGQADPWVEEKRPDLGRIFMEGKKLAGLGAVVSKDESKWLRSYTPGAERSLTPERGRAIMEKILPALQLSRINTIRTQGSTAGRSSGGPSIRLSNSDTVRPNLNKGGAAIDLGGGWGLDPDEVK